MDWALFSKQVVSIKKKPSLLVSCPNVLKGWGPQAPSGNGKHLTNLSTGPSRLSTISALVGWPKPPMSPDGVNWECLFALSSFVP